MMSGSRNNDNELDLLMRKLGKKYEYIKPLGEGGYSKVYLVRHRVFEEEQAIKIMDYNSILRKLKKGGTEDTRHEFRVLKKRFINEAKLYKGFDNPNIVKIYDIDVFDDKREEVEVPFLIMQYIDGVTLKHLIKKNAPFDLERIKSISGDICNALISIHMKKIIHRDIKPANIMVKKGTGKAVIIDFGIAKDILSGTRITETGTTIGTMEYMAPEHFENKVVPVSDIYSFGVILFEMLTGQLPFIGDLPKMYHCHLKEPVPNAREINPDLPEGIEDIVFKAMAKNPGDRYQSPGDMLISFRKIKEKEETNEYIYSETERIETDEDVNLETEEPDDTGYVPLDEIDDRLSARAPGGADTSVDDAFDVDGIGIVDGDAAPLAEAVAPAEVNLSPGAKPADHFLSIHESAFQEIDQTIPFEDEEDILKTDDLLLEDEKYYETEKNTASERAAVDFWLKELEKQRTSTLEKNMVEIFDEFKKASMRR